MRSLIGTLVGESAGDRLNPESSALDVESVEIWLREVAMVRLKITSTNPR